VATYFDKAFSLTPRGKHTVKVCRGTSCYLKHSDKILTDIKEELEKNGDGKNFHVTTASCLGCCTVAPAVEIDGELLDKDSAKSTINKLKGEK
jgi:NADH:ubiquinone oxidoreductase subunit E